MSRGPRPAPSAEALEREGMILFWRPPCCFGQWTPSPFEVDGQQYVNAEQWMMAEKAKLFKDEQVRKEILATTDPREQKRLGRMIENFDEEVWVANRLNIVVQGNMAKFSQNPEMKQKLLNSAPKILVEASPLDKIWGIGLAAENPLAWKKHTWKGSNLLGVALMQVRDALIKSE